MIEVVFYINRQHRYYVGFKTQERSVVCKGEFRNNIDMSNPSIIIDISDDSNITATNPSDINFFKSSYIKYNQCFFRSGLGIHQRNFFIQKVTLLNKGLLQFDLHVDVLQTYYPFIQMQKAFVSRNQYQYDIKLPDERRIVKNEQTSTITEIPNVATGSKVNFSFNTNQTGKYHVVINCIKDQMTKTIFELYSSTFTHTSAIDNIGDISYGFFANTMLAPGVLRDVDLGDVLYEMYTDDNLASYIGGIYAYPFEFTSDDYLSASFSLVINHTTIKDKNNTDVSTYYIGGVSKELILAHFKFNSSDITDFNDLEPYSQYEIYIPYYGWKQIDYNSLLDHELLIYYVVNFINNSTMVYLYDNTTKNIIFSSACQLGVEIPKSVSNLKEVTDRNDANRMNLVLNLIGSMMSTGVGIATANPVAIGGGILTGARALGSAYQNKKTNYERAQIQFGGDGVALMSPQKVYLRKVQSKIQYTLTTDFLAQNGGVLNQLKTLSTVRGYTEVLHIEYLNFPNDSALPVSTIAGIQSELDEITTLLKNGVYFPE